jgi:hypothetical protein
MSKKSKSSRDQKGRFIKKSKVSSPPSTVSPTAAGSSATASEEQVQAGSTAETTTSEASAGSTVTISETPAPPTEAEEQAESTATASEELEGSFASVTETDTVLPPRSTNPVLNLLAEIRDLADEQAQLLDLAFPSPEQTPLISQTPFSGLSGPSSADISALPSTTATTQPASPHLELASDQPSPDQIASDLVEDLQSHFTPNPSRQAASAPYFPRTLPALPLF